MENTPKSRTRGEVYNLAMEKVEAHNMRNMPNCQIRITSDEKSYWVYSYNGKIMIGYPASEGITKPFFATREVYHLLNAKSEITAYVQYADNVKWKNKAAI